MKKVIPSIVFRILARKAMKPMLSVLVLVMLIAMLPSLISQTVTVLTGSDLTAAIEPLYTEERVTAMLGEDFAAMEAATQEIMDGLMAFFEAKWPYMALTAAIVLLASPVLTLGLNHTLLKALRREDFTASAVLARLPLLLRAVGLNLMTGLRIFAWMLPGMGLYILGAVLLLFSQALGVAAVCAGFVVMLVFSIRAMYSYRLAAWIMADEPDTGINAAINRSRDIMKGRRAELFSLDISFIGWRMLLSIAQTMLLALMGNVLGMTLGMFASLFLQLYICMAQAAYYQAYAVGPLPGMLNADGEPGEELN